MSKREKCPKCGKDGEILPDKRREMIRSPLPSSENARTGIRGPATGRPLAKAPLPYLRDLSKGDIKRLIGSWHKKGAYRTTSTVGSQRNSYYSIHPS